MIGSYMCVLTTFYFQSFYIHGLIEDLQTNCYLSVKCCDFWESRWLLREMFLLVFIVVVINRTWYENVLSVLTSFMVESRLFYGALLSIMVSLYDFVDQVVYMCWTTFIFSLILQTRCYLSVKCCDLWESCLVYSVKSDWFWLLMLTL